MLLLSVLVAGCGGAGNAAPKPISGPAKEAAQVVGRLEAATAHKDYATICSDLFAASTRKQAGGPECSEVLAARARGVSHPRITIQAITVEGNRAQVRVRTRAQGQDPATDVIRLVRQNGEFRIASLGR